MKYCREISRSIKNKCSTQIGGIKRMYLINANDWLSADEDGVYLTTNAVAYEIDVAKDSASLVQQKLSVGGSYLIESLLTFTVYKNATNILEQQIDFIQSGFKLLIEFWDRTWQFIDEHDIKFFENLTAVRNSGTSSNTNNAITYTYRLRSYDYGIDYDKMPDIITDGSTDPIWVKINEYCEQN